MAESHDGYLGFVISTTSLTAFSLIKVDVTCYLCSLYNGWRNKSENNLHRGNSLYKIICIVTNNFRGHRKDSLLVSMQNNCVNEL